jgi:hypothetical protein
MLSWYSYYYYYYYNDDDDDDDNNNTISKLFTQYLSHTTGKHEIMDVHKTAILHTAHILREVLM